LKKDGKEINETATANSKKRANPLDKPDEEVKRRKKADVVAEKPVEIEPKKKVELPLPPDSNWKRLKVCFFFICYLLLFSLSHHLSASTLSNCLQEQLPKSKIPIAKLKQRQKQLAEQQKPVVNDKTTELEGGEEEDDEECNILQSTNNDTR
jgi:hypothetical protein